MARTLKSTGLATYLVGCVGVDDDNTTIVDFVGNAVTPHSNVNVGTSTWKTKTVPYFQTYASGSTVEGVSWDSPYPTIASDDTDGVSAMVIMIGASVNTASGGLSPFISIGYGDANTERGLRYITGSGGGLVLGSAPPGGGRLTDTAIPDNGATKFSLAGNFGPNSNQLQAYFGLESGSLALDSSNGTADGGFTTFQLRHVGGSPGFAGNPGKYVLSLVFNKRLTESEFQSIHNDPFGTLFEAAASGPVLSSPTGTATGTTTATIGATTDTATGTLYGFVSTSATPPSATDLKAGTGAVWSGSVAVSSTGAKTLSATGLTAGTGYYAHLIQTDGSANDSSIVTSAQFTTDALTKKLKLLAHADAQGDSGVAGAVWSAPAGSNITGPTKYGEFTGATFEAALEGGKAVLKVPVADFGGSALTTSDTPVALVRNATNTTGIISCTVIEE